MFLELAAHTMRSVATHWQKDFFLSWKVMGPRFKAGRIVRELRNLFNKRSNFSSITNLGNM